MVDCDQQEILPFHTSFFQEYIEKRYEIRTFFLHGRFYSMAIFSQENAKTRIDFRNYDLERPNRFVPYRLPRLVEEKLSKLMDILNLHSGSIDLIQTPTGQYYFLEVNPQGQFQWLSHNCNYFIEREMIRRLLKFKNNNPHERAQ